MALAENLPKIQYVPGPVQKILFGSAVLSAMVTVFLFASSFRFSQPRRWDYQSAAMLTCSLCVFSLFYALALNMRLELGPDELVWTQDFWVYKRTKKIRYSEIAGFSTGMATLNLILELRNGGTFSISKYLIPAESVESSSRKDASIVRGVRASMEKLRAEIEIRSGLQKQP